MKRKRLEPCPLHHSIFFTFFLFLTKIYPSLPDLVSDET